jgi:hypothetical protein
MSFSAPIASATTVSRAYLRLLRLDLQILTTLVLATSAAGAHPPRCPGDASPFLTAS